MKKQNLLKTLLLAVGLLTGASTWAQISTWTYSTTLANNTIGSAFSGSTNGVVSVTLGIAGQASNWAIANNNGNRGLYNSTDAVTYDATNTNVPTGGTFMAVTPTRDIDFSVSCYATANNWLYLVNGSTNARTSLNGGSRWSSARTLSAGKLTAGVTYYFYSSESYEKKFAFNSFTATTYETYTIHYKDGNGTTIKDDVVYTDLYGAEVTASESDMASVEYNDKTYAYSSGNEVITLGTSTNEITLIYATASVCNYTIKYVTDDATPVTIKDDVEVESYVGAEVTATGENFPTYITYNDVRYKYASGNDALTVTGTSATDVITLVYTPCSTFSYSVKAYDSSSNSLGTIASGSYTEGDDAITVAYPQYILSGTTLYNISNNASGDYYRKTFTPDEDNYELPLSYNGSTVSDVVFYTEAESVEGATVGSYTNRASNGQVGYTGAADTYLEATTLSPGKYVIYVKGLNGNKDAKASNFKLGDNVYSFSITQGTNQTGNSEEFTIYETSTLSFASVGNSTTGGVDWFYVVRTGDATVTKNITAAGWATYCSPYALDLENATGLTEAYIVTGGAGGVLAKTSVKGGTVPANTGLLLQGDEGTATIPVVASSSTDVSSSIMTGVTSATEIAAGTGWVLMGSPSLGFYKNTNAFTVGANTAYIPLANLPEPSPVRGFFLLDGETTGVGASLMNNETMNKEIYNLNGQRVAAPQKGLYIVSGKKVIIK